MQGEVLSFREFVYCIDTDEYNFNEYEEWQLEIEEQKLSLLDLPIAYREYCDVRSRGGAKTWIEMVSALYLASLRSDTWHGMGRLRGYWYSTSEDQLEQPKEYFDHILDHSFLSYCVHRRTATRVVFKNYGKLKLTILTTKKARSGRADFAKFDEEAGLRTPKEKELYNAAIGVLSGTWFGLKGHISTPCMASKFEENHDQCKELERITGRVHTFKLPWWSIGFLAKNKEFYEQEKRTKPKWWYEQEYCAEFTLPLGAVLQNVRYEPYPYPLLDEPLCGGIDWNPVSGHWLVQVKWTRDMRNIIVEREHSLGAGHVAELTNEQFQIIARAGSLGERLVMESGGINDEYKTWFNKQMDETHFGMDRQQFNWEEWDSMGLNKLKTITFIIQNGITVWVDKSRFPTLAQMIRDCSWDPDSPEPKIKKDPASSPHALDAFLHAISKKNMDYGQIEVARFY